MPLIGNNPVSGNFWGLYLEITDKRFFMMCLRIENFVRDFFYDLYAILKALPYFFSFALFSIKIFWSKFSGYRENLFDIVSFLEKIFVPKKGTQAP